MAVYAQNGKCFNRPLSPAMLSYRALQESEEPFTLVKFIMILNLHWLVDKNLSTFNHIQLKEKGFCGMVISRPSNQFVFLNRNVLVLFYGAFAFRKLSSSPSYHWRASEPISSRSFCRTHTITGMLSITITCFLSMASFSYWVVHLLPVCS